MTVPSFEIRPLDPDDIARAVDWAAAEGWNPGIDDAGIFAAADPHGFFGGYLGQRLVATISAVTYPGPGGGFGFVGFYIVTPGQRGQGNGFRLWQHVMQHLDPIPVVGLDGVVDQQPNYRKSGFVLAHRNIRYAGTVPGREGGAVIPATTVPLESLVAFDAQHFPVPRPGFLRLWLNQPSAKSLVVRDGDDDVVAFGTIRRCRTGWKVGPLFGSNPDAAEEVLLALAYHAGPGTSIFVDVPETNPAAARLVRRFGMEPMFETARMYRGPDPGLRADRIFGVTTFELG